VVLAQATYNLAGAFQSINDQYPESETLRKLLLKLLLKFAGEQQDDETIAQIMKEAKKPVSPAAIPRPQDQPNPPGRSEEPKEDQRVKSNGHRVR
jgi:methionine-rich copper-binding protein CopC